MKKVLYISLLFLMPFCVSCINDLGNDVMTEINKIEISGIEESYSVIAKQETLVINPEIKGSLSASDESNLSYEWFLCDNGITNHNHYTIGTERNLNYFVESSPANYTLHFAVTDKSTGLKWEHETSLAIVSPMVRGFYLMGDKADGTVAMDFMSYIEGRDTSIISDVYKNTKGLKGVKSGVFTGYYITADVINLWVMAENGSYQLQNSASLTEFSEMTAMADPNSFIFPTVPVSKPQQVMDILPHPYGKANTNRCRSYARIMLTKDAAYSTSMMSLPEAYGNPFNRYSTSSTELFQPSPYVFHKDNSTSVSAIMLFDETHHCFVRCNYSSYSAPTYCTKLSNDGTPFYLDQTNYTPVRDLVYGQNGYGNAGRSYALMTNENGEYFIYTFTVASASSITAHAAYDVDFSVATDFDKASHYAFFTLQPIILYSVGSNLYAYDYARKECVLVNTFDSEITYLAMDYESNNDTKHVWVATYGGGKGKVYGYNVADNQNAVQVTPVQHEVFETGVKVVKMVYRNVAN